VPESKGDTASFLFVFAAKHPDEVRYRNVSAGPKTKQDTLSEFGVVGLSLKTETNEGLLGEEMVHFHFELGLASAVETEDKRYGVRP